MVKNVLLISDSIKSNIKNMLIFGLLAALFANIKFSIPGLEHGTSDAREIVALISVAFLTHWIYAVGVGLIASFGSYHSLTVTILLHITSIPIAWVFLKYIKNKINNIALLATLWGIMLTFQSIFVYPVVYTVSHYFLNNIEFHNIINSYMLFMKGTRFEILINITFTSFAIFSIFIFKEVKKNSTYLQLIEKNTELGFWDWDIQNNKIIYNEQWAKMIGYNLDEIKNNLNIWRELLHPDDFTDAVSKLNENIDGTTNFYDAEYRLKSKSGHYIWIHDRGKVLARNADGKALRMVGIHLDMTKQKQLTEKIQNLQNYLSNIINSMPSMIIGVSLEGKITQWNNKVEKITGLKEKDVHGKNLIDILPHMETDMDLIKESIYSRKVTSKLKQQRKINDEIFYEDVIIYPLTANGVSGAVIRIDDVTEKVNIEEMMIQSEKMISIGGLAAGMAHEINNPLAGILQNLQVIENRIFSEIPVNINSATECGTTLNSIIKYMKVRKIEEMISNIKTSGKRAAEIVANMLNFARKETSVKRNCSIPDLLDKTLELAKNEYNLKKHYDFRKIEIIKNFEDNIPDIICEPGKIQQVFFNIIKNGTEAMQEMNSKDFIPKFEFKVYKNNKMLTIEIIDNGPGIEDTAKERIFEPFFTTKKVGKGTGLGMSISYYIIKENHQGNISVDSLKGKWTKFVIDLPIGINKNK